MQQACRIAMGDVAGFFRNHSGRPHDGFRHSIRLGCIRSVEKATLNHPSTASPESACKYPKQFPIFSIQ